MSDRSLQWIAVRGLLLLLPVLWPAGSFAASEWPAVTGFTSAARGSTETAQALRVVLGLSVLAILPALRHGRMRS